MNRYKEITIFLKTMTMTAAYDYLSNNVGILNSPDIDVSKLTPVIPDHLVGIHDPFALAFNKENPKLLAPHSFKEKELILLGAKPLILDDFNIKDHFNDNEKLPFVFEDNYVSIDQVYIDLFKMARSKFKTDKSSHLVAGTILGYSKSSIEVFRLHLHFYGIYGLKQLGFFEVNKGS